MESSTTLRRRASLLVVVLVGGLLLAGCTKKKVPRTIVTSISIPAVRNDTTALPDRHETERFLWGDSFYETTITRHAEREAALISDADGNKYYDNSVALTIVGSTGTLFQRTFRKADFAAYVDSDYLPSARSTLTNIAFDGVADGNATFIAAIGSPDEMDDEFMLVLLRVSKTGQIAMERIDEME